MHRVTRQFAAWIACCAMLFAALAPSLSLATPAKATASWTEICSVAGMKMVQVADADADHAPAKQASHVPHCPLCATHASACILPPQALAMAAPPLVAPRQPVLFLQAPRRLPVWTPAQSRAPPVVS